MFQQFFQHLLIHPIGAVDQRAADMSRHQVGAVIQIPLEFLMIVLVMGRREKDGYADKGQTDANQQKMQQPVFQRQWA